MLFWYPTENGRSRVSYNEITKDSFPAHSGENKNCLNPAYFSLLTDDTDISGIMDHEPIHSGAFLLHWNRDPKHQVCIDWIALRASILLDLSVICNWSTVKVAFFTLFKKNNFTIISRPWLKTSSICCENHETTRH